MMTVVCCIWFWIVDTPDALGSEIRELFSRRERSTHLAPRCRPCLEPLEDRYAPAVLMVTTNADAGAGSLRAQVAVSAPGDTINFAIANQTIALTTGEIEITKNLTIDGQNQKITINGNQASRIFNISAVAATAETINGLTFVGGVGKTATGQADPRDGEGGAILDTEGALTLSKDQFYNNFAEKGGGAVYEDITGAGGVGPLTVDGCDFRSNSTHNTNHTSWGGALYASYSQAAGTTILNNTSFTSNTADYEGGAVLASGFTGSKLTATDCVFTSNAVLQSGDRPGYSGGAIWTDCILSVSSSLTVSKFDSNSAANGGGGIMYAPEDSSNSSMALKNVSFSNNVAETGGAVESYVNSTSGTVNVSVTGCLFSGNEAHGPTQDVIYMRGGGLAIIHNTADTASASTSITNCTFYHNMSDSDGGGIYLNLNNAGTGTSTAALTSLTVYQNGALFSGGGVWIATSGATHGAPPPQVWNSIIAGNEVVFGLASSGFDVFGTVDSKGFNLIGQATRNVGDPNAGNSGWIATDLTGTTINPKDPGLDPAGPQNNGGKTYTIKVPTTSAAYRKGDPNLAGTMDERGLTRQQDKVTIGAYDPDAI